MTVAEECYTVERVVKITGAHYPNILYWVRQGLVKPSVCQEGRRGKRLLFSTQDILEVKLIETLRERAPLKRVRRVLDYLRALSPDHWHSSFIDAATDDIHVYSSEEEV